MPKKKQQKKCPRHCPHEEPDYSEVCCRCDKVLRKAPKKKPFDVGVL